MSETAGPDTPSRGGFGTGFLLRRTSRRTVDFVEGLQDLADLDARQTVVDRLRFAPRRDEIEGAHFRQMLRKRGGAQSDDLREIADGALAVDEITQYQQALGVGHRAQHQSRFVGFALEQIHIGVAGRFRHCGIDFSTIRPEVVRPGYRNPGVIFMSTHIRTPDTGEVK